MVGRVSDKEYGGICRSFSHLCPSHAISSAVFYNSSFPYFLLAFPMALLHLCSSVYHKRLVSFSDIIFPLFDRWELSVYVQTPFVSNSTLPPHFFLSSSPPPPPFHSHDSPDLSPPSEKSTKDGLPILSFSTGVHLR